MQVKIAALFTHLVSTYVLLYVKVSRRVVGSPFEIYNVNENEGSAMTVMKIL